MTVDSSTIPLALQIPDIPYPIRLVRQSDITALRANCWAHRSLKNSCDLLRTVTNSANKGRGLGIVVETDTAHTSIIGYGQILRLSQCAEISDLIVTEAYRSQGIGTAMIQYLIDAICVTGVQVIEIGVAERNSRARALYQHLGFDIAYDLHLNLGKGRERVLYLRLSIPDNIKKTSHNRLVFDN